MKFLHTADWHLGRTMRGKSRASEHEAVLAELLEIAKVEAVDAMLVCGDIWDTASPSPESDRLLNEALREFIGLGVAVVLIAGNHDSARKLDALGRLSELLGVQTQAFVRRPDEGGILTVTTAEETARIAAIPWVQEGRVIDAVEVLGLAHEQLESYAQRTAELYRAMCEPFSDRDAARTINILAGHLFVDGALLAAVDGSERLLHIGQAYGVAPAALPSTPQYIALGHIHQPQEVLSTTAPAAYSGSLLQLDFGEREQEKVVRIIEAHPGLPVEQHAVPITKGRRLVEVRGTLDAVVAQAEDVADAYVRVVLDVDGPQPGLAQRVRKAIPSAVDVRLDYPQRDGAAPEPGLAHLSPQDLFATYYRAQHGAAPAAELVALFSEMLDEAAIELAQVAHAPQSDAAS
jgi:exonuclease SbcD